MHILEIKLQQQSVNLAGKTFSEVIGFVMSFYTPAETSSLINDFNRAVSADKIVEQSNSLAYANVGLSPFDVDSNNVLTMRLIIKDISSICADVFDPPNVGFNPIKKYFDSNPANGSYSLKVFDLSGNDVTVVYSKV